LIVLSPLAAIMMALSAAYGDGDENVNNQLAMGAMDGGTATQR
jgi:hypothetical protein